MIAGTGVSMGGAGMLRTRRRDVSIKPNRKLDRKSSRGMIYENEELRLRTIHINAEVEQGQNDIKKLRRENEQLRREIWGLRDEYDKLEELLKKQKVQAKLNEIEEENSEDSGSESSDDTDDEDDEDDDDEEEDDKAGEKKEDISSKEERLENTENQKISSESANNDSNRLRVNFDELSVVDEEEELKKGREAKKGNKNSDHKNQEMRTIETIPSSSYYPLPYESSSNNTSSSYHFPPNCPFVFPSPTKFNLPSRRPDNTVFLIPTCSPIYSNSATPMSNTPGIADGSQEAISGLLAFAPFDQSPRSSESSAQTESTVVVSPKIEPAASRFQMQLPATSNAIHSNIPNTLEREQAGQETSTILRKPKHFFAPLLSKSQQQMQGELSPISSNDIAENKYQFTKGSADIFIDTPVLRGKTSTKNENGQNSFLSSEELFVNGENKSSPSSDNLLVRSLSCQNLPSACRQESLAEGVQTATSNSKTHLHAKSDNTLDTSKPFRSKLNVTLKSPNANRESSPAPEVPAPPSFAGNFFNDKYRQHFQQYYANSAQNPLTVQVSDPCNQQFCLGFNCYNFLPVQSPDFGKPAISEENAAKAREIQVTSFEKPSPHTLQFPSMTPCDLSLLFSKIPALDSGIQSPGVYQTAANQQEIKVHCETCTKKVPARTQTSPEDNSSKEDQTDQKQKKTKKEKRQTSAKFQKRRERQKKQTSVTSSDVPDTPTEALELDKTRTSVLEENNESRSSSSGRESPKNRMSLYFTPRKKSVKGLSLDINKAKRYSGAEILDSSEKEKMSPARNEKGRKTSTSSGNVPWCACWGNGCI